jgi:hypothetical protein
MATFPNLKTGAVVQYPARKDLRFQNQTLRFLDGTEQRYRDSAGALRRWDIRLDQLDEGEMAALEQFFAETEGAYGAFAFTDPWDGHKYENCSLETDGLDLTALAETRGSTWLTVVENRG